MRARFHCKATQLYAYHRCLNCLTLALWLFLGCVCVGLRDRQARPAAVPGRLQRGGRPGRQVTVCRICAARVGGGWALSARVCTSLVCVEHAREVGLAQGGSTPADREGAVRLLPGLLTCPRECARGDLLRHGCSGCRETLRCVARTALRTKLYEQLADQVGHAVYYDALLLAMRCAAATS